MICAREMLVARHILHLIPQSFHRIEFRAIRRQTEARLLEDLDGLCAGRTTFIVVHRLSALRNVDRILAFQCGRIVEDISH
jgi:ABC-type transport system involved in Fe-S cluster assembly fused permease/ATPase subunit